MADPVLSVPLYESPSAELNKKLSANWPGERCICCMKPMKNKPSLFVHMNEAWQAVNPTLVNEINCQTLTGFNSQGLWPIGRDCASHMPSAFIIQTDRVNTKDESLSR